MSAEALKKRKAKVLRTEGGTPEVKRGRGDGDMQVSEALGRCTPDPGLGSGGVIQAR